jgi:citronellol/citronellal dehydrogenase
MTATLAGKTLFITGASRGIGLAIALRAARDGANVAIAAKTAEPHPKLPGTIYIRRPRRSRRPAARRCLSSSTCATRRNVKEALDKTAAHFGGLDIVVNNASAISLTNSQATDMKRYDLMHQINARGTFMVSKYAIPHLLKASNPHILMLSPPLDMKEKWFRHAHRLFDGEIRHEHGRARPRRRVARQDRRQRAVAAHADRHGGGAGICSAATALVRASRTPDILADAAHHPLHSRQRANFTGQFIIDDTFLYEHGVRDFDRYRVDPSQPLWRPISSCRKIRNHRSIWAR